MKNIFKKFQPQGFVLLTTIVVMSLLLLLAIYVVGFTITELKISTSQSTATKTYYLAETGINEMLWKIQNDPLTGLSFVLGTLNSTNNIDRTSVFGNSEARYQVAAINTVPAEAWIIATSTYQIAGKMAQRVVKSYISQATNSSEKWDFGVFAGGRGSQQNGNFTFTGSGIVFIANGGRLHANQVFKVQGAEIVINDGGVTAANNINVIAGGKLTLNDSYQQAPTTTVDMLQIDFNSADLNSWKNRATTEYTATQFSALPSDTTLNGIIYVSGTASVVNKNLTVNGVLVAENNINITTSGQNFTMNFNPAYGAGLLAKNNINITASGGAYKVDGLIYSGNKLSIVSSGTNFVINGSLTGFDASVTASGGAITLNYLPENFLPVIDPEYNPASPVIQIDHWEEEY